MFADDIANCAETVIRLQQQLNIIDKFCLSTGMELNLEKTEIIVFRNGGHLRANEKWIFRGQPINVTSVYKYMGLLFTPYLSWVTAQKKLASQAQKSIYAIYGYQEPFGHFNIKQLLQLFDSMVKPILCYGSQVWGYKYSPDIEAIQLSFCKRYLGVKGSTNNSIVLGECGRLPLCVTYYSNFIKYWCKLTQMEDSRYPKRCYYMLKSLDNVNRITWATYIKNMLFMYGFGFVWVSHEVGDINAFIKVFKQRIIDCHTQNWHASLNESSRCHYYKHFKTLLNTERYLTMELPVKFRLAMSRFRCSSHKLNVEIGRHNKVPFELRICSYCNQNYDLQTVECEYHVFFECGKYTDIRNQYLLNWYSLNTNLQGFFNILNSSDEKVIHSTAVYINKLLSMIN